MLAVLQWMIELLEYDSGVQDQVDDFEQEDSEKFFFGHLVRSYDAFMSGADDEDAQDAELEERFEMRDEAVQADVDRLDEENAALRAEIEKLQSQEAEVQANEARRDEMRNDVQSFEKLPSRSELLPPAFFSAHMPGYSTPGSLYASASASKSRLP